MSRFTHPTRITRLIYTIVLIGVVLTIVIRLIGLIHPASTTPVLSPTQPVSRAAAQVLRVIDGDTMIVSLDGKEEKVRVIGINTPETVNPRQKVECFGKEAKEKAEEIFFNNSLVYLEQDSSQSNRDRYGRLLRYIKLTDGTDYGKFMIENGYAYEYTYADPYRFQSEYRAAQQKAIEGNHGLWAEDGCDK